MFWASCVKTYLFEEVCTLMLEKWKEREEGDQSQIDWSQRSEEYAVGIPEQPGRGQVMNDK